MAVNDLVTGGNLGPEFQIGTNVPNQITINTDGTSVIRDGVTGELSSPPGVMTYVPGTATLTYTDGQGGVQNIDLSGLTTDIYVDGGTYDPNTMILTLTDNDAGTPDVTVDLSGLLGVSTDANNLLVNGADGKPFLDVPALQAAFNVCQDVFGTNLFRALPL